MSVSFDYSGKVALVTGAGTGIGRETALAFAKAKAYVAIIGRSENNIQETLRLVTEMGGQAIAIQADVSQEDSIKAAIEKTVETFGKLDFAFNNAGIEHKAIPAADIPSEEWDRIISTNLNGVFFSMKHEIPAMLKSGSGSIVNTASGAGVKGFPGNGAYCASKFGLIGLSKAAALDYAKQHLRINVVAPGIIETPMMQRFTGGTEEGRETAIAQEPVGRAGHPKEIAGTVLWLCSDLAAFTTGSVFVVDGGQTA
ncbi:glucose 1-dehydrogenase [Zymomonas mobilis]|nr:glucose 1-dehydrogenase [Zymomonas mobilis]AAF18285.1 hypothetical protein [Zymomonas mobilis subsp. mobilis ZM4 = ATCC 31821]UBQ07501.1 glucose 1-dehydrogenase [Zymomonas mobilis]